MSLSVSIEQREGATVLSITGELDMSTAPQLQERVDEVTGAGQRRLVFDLSTVPFCDSTGLTVFVKTNNHCEDLGGFVRLAGPQRAVRRILEVSGLIDVLATYSTVDEAVSSPAPAAEGG